MTLAPLWELNWLQRRFPMPCLTYNECPNPDVHEGRYITIYKCKCHPRWYRHLYLRVINRKLRRYLYSM